VSTSDKDPLAPPAWWTAAKPAATAELESWEFSNENLNLSSAPSDDGWNQIEDSWDYETAVGEVRDEVIDLILDVLDSFEGERW